MCRTFEGTLEVSTAPLFSADSALSLMMSQSISISGLSSRVGAASDDQFNSRSQIVAHGA